MKQICIIGGGASGLMAAITAARKDASARITIIEKKEKPGKKLLATGNGRCNLTNANLSVSAYRSDNPEMIGPVLDAFGYEDTLSFFDSLGLLLKKREDYIYPRNDQAASVLNQLLLEAKRLGVVFFNDETVTTVGKRKTQFEIITSRQTLLADRLILATGGKASSALGSDGSGYGFAKTFGHSLRPVTPALVQLQVSNHPFKDASGVRTQALVTAYVDGEYLASDTGELQITAYGISGIPVFQISRFIAKGLAAGKDCLVRVDLLPEYKQKNCKKLLKRLMAEKDKLTIEELLSGIFPLKLVASILKYAKLQKTRYASKLTEDEMDRLILSFKRMDLSIFDTMGFDHAQVCAGGVSLSEIDLSTMMSKKCEHLYLIGELLDVDGICGGYNLQWAWSTGYLAGMHV